MKAIQIDSKIKKPRFRSYPIRRGRRLAESRINEQEISFRNINKREAKNEIQEYINKHPQGSLTSEIIEALRINPLIAEDILEEMKQEGSTFSKLVE
jgi:hypothetical protein